MTEIYLLTFSTLLICDSGKTASITKPPLSVTTGPESPDDPHEEVSVDTKHDDARQMKDVY